MSYVQTNDQKESPLKVRRHIYNTLVTLGKKGKQETTMRIEALHPEIKWETVWKNLNAAWIPNTIKTTWYHVIHDIEPTNNRLAKIKLSNGPLCNLCNKTDTILHRTTECNEAENIWKWTQERIAQILRTNPRNIQPKWTTTPDFNFWPPQRTQAILWIIAHMVYYCVEKRQQLNEKDYADFLQRSKWKAYQKAHRRERIANYLIVLD